jgi:two-component sensor histidine kinase
VEHSTTEELLRQQTALARFGELTLRSEDLTEILQTGVRLVAEGLHTELAKVLELGPNGLMLVRAGVGWEPGIVGQQLVDPADGTLEALALATREPIIAANVEKETRFRVADFVLAHGVRSFVNVNVAGPPGGRPYGILEVDSRAPRNFTADDIDFLRTYANLIAAAVQRMQTMAELRESAAEKQSLLDELQHRVKNNLQMIMSLIRLQANSTGSPEAHQELQNIAARIDTLRLIHEKLYATEEVDRIELGGYLTELSNSLLRFHRSSASSVRLITDSERLFVSAQTAVPLGLITNEFITNSLKHAFPKQVGTIGIRLESLGEHTARLTLWDDGQGLPETRVGGTGLRLIEALSGQVASEARWKGDGGTRLELTVAQPRLADGKP